MKRILSALAVSALFAGSAPAADITLLNVSYDPTVNCMPRSARLSPRVTKHPMARPSRSSPPMAAPASKRVR